MNKQDIIIEYAKTHKASSVQQFQIATRDIVDVPNKNQDEIFTEQDFDDEDDFMDKADDIFAEYAESTKKSRLGHLLTYFDIKGTINEKKIKKYRNLIKEIKPVYNDTTGDMTYGEATERLHKAFNVMESEDTKRWLLFYATQVPVRPNVLMNTIVVIDEYEHKRLKNHFGNSKNYLNVEENSLEINQDKSILRSYELEGEELVDYLDTLMEEEGLTNFQFSEKTKKSYTQIFSKLLFPAAFQGLRHLYVSMLVNTGISKNEFKDKAQKLGHSEITSLQIYNTKSTKGFLHSID